MIIGKPRLKKLLVLYRNTLKNFLKKRKYDLISVQPLSQPVGKLFYTDFVYTFRFEKKSFVKIIGNSPEEFFCDLIGEWNEFIYKFNFYTNADQERLVKTFKRIGECFIKQHPNIYKEYLYTDYEYKVFEYCNYPVEYPKFKTIKKPYLVIADQKKPVLFDADILLKRKDVSNVFNLDNKISDNSSSSLIKKIYEKEKIMNKLKNTLGLLVSNY